MYCLNMTNSSMLKAIFIAASLLVLSSMIKFPHNQPIAASIGLLDHITNYNRPKYDTKASKIIPQVIHRKGVNVNAHLNAQPVAIVEEPLADEDYMSHDEQFSISIDKIQKLTEEDGRMFDRLQKQVQLMDSKLNIVLEKVYSIHDSVLKSNRIEDPVWEEDQIRRKKVLKDACSKIDGEGKWSKPYDQSLHAAELSDNLFVDHKHKAIYCYIPKIACTEWKRLIMVLAGTTKFRDPQLITHDDAHYHNHLKQLNQMNTTNIAKALDNYEKFMFVRNPYERLLSTYLSKFVSNSSDAADFKKQHAVYMMGIVKGKGVPFPSSGEGMTFTEFITYLSMSKDPYNFQEHWKSYFYLCHPCTIDYDVIGKYDTLEKDSNMILDRLNSKLKFPKYSPSSTKERLKKFLSTITDKNVLDNFYTNYEKDFHMFGYEKYNFTHI